MAKMLIYQTMFFILLSLLTFVQSQDEWIEYYQDKGGCEGDYEHSGKTKKYAVEFHKTKDGEFYDGPLYLKVEVTVEKSPPPLLCFSHNDAGCDDRDLLIRNPNEKSVYFWVKREQFLDATFEPYFTVTCPNDEDSCKYHIKCSESGDSYAEFKPNFVYSYLITARNQEMDFKIKNVPEGHRLVICVDGSPNVQLIMKLGDEILQEDNTFCSNVENSNIEEEYKDDFGKFKIKAQEGDYITLSVHTYSYSSKGTNLGRASKGFLMPNGPTVTSMIYIGNTFEECFPLDKEILDSASNTLYISGKIQSKYVWFFLEDENEDFIAASEVEAFDGQFSYVFKNENKLRYVCLEIIHDDAIFVFNQDSLMFSVQVVDYGKLIYPLDYTDPMISGVLYRKIIPKGQIAYYYGAKTDISSNKYDYSITRVKGLSKLYIDYCTNFPFCRYKDDDLANVSEDSPSIINNHQIWTINEDYSSAIGREKYVMIVKCEDNKLNGDYCIFDISIAPKNKDIYLVEDQKLPKFTVSNEKGNLVIDLKKGPTITKIFVSITIYSGDTIFSVKDKDKDLDCKQYYLSNKVAFVLSKQGVGIDKVTIEYTTNLNSYFTVRYTTNFVKDEETYDMLSSGESYLVQINPTSASKSKAVLLNNLFGNLIPFMANFFALNCEFTVERQNSNGEKVKDIEFSDGYAQDNLNAGELSTEENYLYNVKIKEAELSNYNNKMCMLYVSGFEITEDYEREIVVPENINQQIIFEDNFKKIRFNYPIVNITKRLSIHVNVIDKAHYKIKGSINGQVLEGLNDLKVAVTSTYFIPEFNITKLCTRNRVCSLTLDVEMEKKIVNTNPMVEITFREVLNIPTYLQKNSFKLDYVCGDRFYYLYTDIGKNDVGEITLNFLREFGSIWAKVVKKDLQTPEKEANWRKVFRMPGPEWEDSLPFDDYTKKLKISTDDTKDCINGCYLLMTIQINDIGDYVPDYIFYSFSILAKVTPSSKSYADIPKVVIQVDEFIVGSLNTDEIDEKYITEFYEIWLPHDSDQVELDWQSSIVSLFVNVGGSRPTTKNADFVLPPPARDSSIILEKKDILEKAKKRGIIKDDETSIQDISLVIGVWTNKTDSVDHELYSLRVHQRNPSDDTLDIIDVKYDQKVVCKPKLARLGYDSVYRCLFMISFNADKTIDSPMYIYGFSSNAAADVNLYGSFVDKDLYNAYDVDELKKLIPTSENAEYNTYYDDVKYIYVSTLQNNQTFFINLYSHYNEDLYLINSMPIYNTLDGTKIQEVYPDSHTEQLFACPQYNLHMKFSGDEGISATIEALTGEAIFKWSNDNDIFKLKDAKDRINLFSDKNNRKLEITNLQPIKNSLMAKIENPGFLFFVKYKARANEINFDEVDFGKSTEMYYKNTDLPVVLYTKIGGKKVYRDLHVAITFKNIGTQEYGQLNGSPITIQASILKENTVYSAKKKKDIMMKPSKEKSLFGTYDVAIKTALIFFSKEKIGSYNLKDSDNPTLYIRIDKRPEPEYESIKYEKFDIETQVAGINDDVVPVEKIYHYGKLGETQNEVFYNLKIDRNKPFMRIHIAFNSDDLDFTVHQLKNSLSNQTYDYYRSSKERGKVIVTFTVPDIDNLYLNIFRKKGVTPNEKLSNYVFKYINGKAETDFYDYKMMYPNITLREYKNISKSNADLIDVKFNKIHEDLGKANITYFLKVVENSTYIYGESMNTIAATESPEYVLYDRNPINAYDEEDPDKLTLIAEGQFKNWAYINVIAQIQQNNIIEYVAYNGVMKIRPPPGNEEGEGDSDEGGDNTVLFGVIGGILGAVAIGLVVVIVVFQIKNRSLLNQVKHVSFQKTNTNADPNLLLQKSVDGEINQA